MTRVQTLVQLSDELVAALDQRAAQTGRSRSDLIREAVERYGREQLDAEIDRQIVESYRRKPQEDVWGGQSAKRMIAQEPS